MKLIRRIQKPVSIVILLTFLQNILMPSFVMGITGHDSMPEYRSFEPVATTNMVNLFDGSFTYNIPLIDVPNGYPISLSYHSNDVNNEAMASWVGLGWNINPGTINRMKRGFPDEFKGEVVRYHGRMPANWTISASIKFQPELFGKEDVVKLDAGASIRYNNYNGIGTAVTAGLGFAGVANLNFSHSQGRFGFNPEINPFHLLNVDEKFKERKRRKPTEQKLSDAVLDKRSADKLEEALSEKPSKKSPNRSQIGMTSMSFGGFSGSRQVSQFSMRLNQPAPYPVTISKYRGYMVSLRFDLGINLISLPIDFEASGSGSYVNQKNEPFQDIPVFGYQNNEEADLSSNKESMMDYFTENEKLFEKRDNMLGYPIPNNDVYNMSGEAMGGSFRPFRSEFGHYRKNHVKSEDISIEVGADVNLASIAVLPPNPFYILNTEYSYGGQVAGDYHWTTVGKWDNMGPANNYGFRNASSYPRSNEKYFFRFSGDKAGFFDLSNNNDIPFSAELDKSLVNAEAKVAHWSGSSQFIDYRSADKSKKRSTYILHHLNSDFSKTVTKGGETYKYKVYEKKARYIETGGNVSAYDHTMYNHNATGEIITYNNDGVTYVYGLPVYSRNEKELQYSLKPQEVSFAPGTQGLIASVAGGDIDATAKRKLGYESSNNGTNAGGEYATAHLLTQILSPDYIDRTGDGPTSDDFGSFTKFNYQRVAGGTNWYKYRTPYTGVNYNLGSLSDRDDDMGSFSSGEKEIYFLHSIVSKTHVAIFTLENREDGKSAGLSNSATANQLLTGADGTAPQSLQRLKRIDLYTIEDCEPATGNDDIGIWKPKTGSIPPVPIKTVHFKYNYSLCTSLPNNTNPGPLNEGGKLTLEKVWFEYGGKLPSKISPYEFQYSYHNVPYPAPYNIGNINSYSTFSATQNPQYTPVNTDRWGNYRDYTTMAGSGSNAVGEASQNKDLARFWPYVHQNPNYNSFDPAAWCLKKITLPSGGELHVQYEQNDYQFVQNKRAMAMVPLSSATLTAESNSAVSDKKYYLNLEKLGIVVPPGSEKQLAEDLFEPMIKEKQRIYFNFLYALIGNNPDYRNTNSDYLEGYARINGYGFDSNGIYFTFKGGVGSNFYPISYASTASKREIPRIVCRDFYKSQRRGKIDGGQNAAALEKANESEPGQNMVNAFTNMVDHLSDGFDTKCQAFDPLMSYVRVQLPAGNYKTGGKICTKLGGGVRVKRLLMFDQGMIDSDPDVLFGNEYHYTTNLDDKPGAPVISSGVATNEPGNGRRESPLVNPIEKDEQTKLSAILFGRDMYGQEGPLGESLLPAASIGYSKVTVKNIYSGITGTGSEVHEYNTVKDYPFEASKTIVDQAFKHPLSISVNIAGVSVSYTRKTPYLAQGYSFKSYSMHGQPKQITKYAQNSPDKPLATETYEYFKPGDQVSLMGKDMLQTTVPYELLGKESEILSEGREVNDYTVGGQVGLDVSGGGALFLIPMPFPTPIFVPVPIKTKVDGGGFINENIYRTHVTSKIITYPSILKKVINKADGVTNITENVVLDDNTGEPVITKSYDDFKGTYVNQDFKAAWKYENMQSKYKNENLKILPPSGGTITYTNSGSNEYLTFTGNNGCGVLTNFTRGDFIELGHQGTLYHINKIDLASSRLYIVPSQYNGFTPSSSISYVQVLRSGYTNQLNSSIGNVMYFSKEGNSSYYAGTNNFTQNSGFVAALNTATASIQGNGFSSISIPGTFTGMNISNYAARLPASCNNVNLFNATISGVLIEITVSGAQMTLVLKSFTITGCNGSNYTISCASPVSPNT